MWKLWPASRERTKLMLISACGHSTQTADGHELVKKRTVFMTNSQAIKHEIAVWCDGKHQHGHLVNGRTVAAATYPRRLVEALLRGIRRELQGVGQMYGMNAGGPTVDEASVEVQEQDFVNKVAGDPAPENQSTSSRFWDEITGKELNPEKVLAARRADVEYMRRLGVYEEATEEDCIRDGCTPIPMRWIDTNKGDDRNENIRSRAVLQETRRRSNLGSDGDVSQTFAATPPLEALRAMISLCMSQKGIPESKRKVLGVYDVSRAHFHSPAKRTLYVKTLPEDVDNKIGIAKLLKAMYGSKDAAACWDEFAEKTMEGLSYKAGCFNPCLYRSTEQDGEAIRHGDDFVLLASREEHRRFLTEANKAMILKLSGILGPRKAEGDQSEIRCLNRIIRYTQPAIKAADEAYIDYEPDGRHVEILLKQLGIASNSNSLGQPGCKRDAAGDQTPLVGTEMTLYK